MPTKHLQHYYLEKIGIDLWLSKTNKANKKNCLDLLAKQITTCVNCQLHRNRKNVVFARGNPQAKLLLIGEAPGFHEDQQGLPFVGKAGSLLQKMLYSIGIKDDDVYITNMIKCRPPANRDPNNDEIFQCSVYLQQQISLLQPRFILALGRFAAQFLANKPLPLARLRQKLLKYHEIPFTVTFHPAYLLRQPVDKKKAYMDLLFMRQFII